MTIDIIKELHRITGKLASMIAQEQDDAINNALVDMYDAAGMALKLLKERDWADFQGEDATNAPPVSMDHNG